MEDLIIKNEGKKHMEKQIVTYIKSITSIYPAKTDGPKQMILYLKRLNKHIYINILNWNHCKMGSSL